MDSNYKELEEKVQYIKKFITPISSSVKRLLEFFNDKFNYEIVKAGDKMTYDLDFIFRQCPSVKKRFKDDPIQPITVTYVRLDVIFFTWDKHPEFPEEYTMYDSDWSAWLYPSVLRLSDLWKNKEYLKKKDYEEWYVQTRSLEISDKYTKVIDDLDK